MKLLQINSVLNYGSTGKIVEQIALTAQDKGWESIVAHSVKYLRTTTQKEIIIGDKWDVIKHESTSFFFDRHGLASRQATMKLIEAIKKYSPDVIHLHNIHGYYLNYLVLFEYLKAVRIPVIWTLHDCWSFTGHCSYFNIIGCDKWKYGCEQCPGLNAYPRSLVVDRSSKNYILKKYWFTAISDRLTIVPVSHWLEGLVRQSFFKSTAVQTIHNGIDLNVFQPLKTYYLREKLKIGDKKVIIGVASFWGPRKGFGDMLKLANLLSSDKFQVIVVGLSDKQCQQCPKNVIGIKRTCNIEELAKYYSLAFVYVNPTYEDNYPTTNLEAMACGTPVITYRTGGSPEAVSPKTGWVVDQGNISNVAKIIENMAEKEDCEIFVQRKACREHAEKEFDRSKCFEQYISLYESRIKMNKKA